MSLSITNDGKNALSVTNTAKPNLQWQEANLTWAQAQGTWESPGVSILRETKNSVTITNDTKN